MIKLKMKNKLNIYKEETKTLSFTFLAITLAICFVLILGFASTTLDLANEDIYMFALFLLLIFGSIFEFIVEKSTKNEENDGYEDE